MSLTLDPQTADPRPAGSEPTTDPRGSAGTSGPYRPEVVWVTAPDPIRLPGPSWRVLLSLFLLGVVITGACAEAAYLLAKRQPEIWAARSEIEYRGNDSWVETQQVALASRDFQEPIASAEGIPIDELSSNLTTTLVPGTQALRIEYQDEDADRAERVVSALTVSYMTWVQDRPTSAPEGRVELQQRIDAIDVQLAGLRDQLAGIEVEANEPVPTRVTLLQTEIQSLLVEKSGLETELFRLEQDQRDEVLDNEPNLLASPYVLDDPVAPAPVRRAVLGALAGLLISAALAFAVLRSRLVA